MPSAFCGPRNGGKGKQGLAELQSAVPPWSQQERDSRHSSTASLPPCAWRAKGRPCRQLLRVRLAWTIMRPSLAPEPSWRSSIRSSSATSASASSANTPAMSAKSCSSSTAAAGPSRALEPLINVQYNVAGVPCHAPPCRLDCKGASQATTNDRCQAAGPARKAVTEPALSGRLLQSSLALACCP